MSNPLVINSLDTEPQWRALGREARKIVLGQPGGNEARLKLVGWPEDLAGIFPNLTHLHLWQVEGLEVWKPLPTGLRWLDLRGCPDLKALPPLPDSLDTLILEDCPNLRLGAGKDRTVFPKLDELSIKGSGSIPEAWLHAVLAGAPNLRLLDASDCPRITRIVHWPPSLEDARLDGCPALKALPAWRPRLRRIGLRGASSLLAIPDFTAALDYVDLAGTESLRGLPPQRGQPRTLYLYGSGLLMPPASEHGVGPDENVAERTEAYFADVALTGQGEVKRCKLLLLGNGGAGKTCLSLALTDRDPRLAAELGSTHGIQFWDWSFRANLSGAIKGVNLHLWDFGGQEIYHNTHRLFMSTGAVFVVLWKPEQDGGEAPESECGYQDEWRPLLYWLDFIHLACPQKPRIAIVCSHHGEKTEELDARWRGQVSERDREECPCFYIDSLSGVGELGELKTWLQDHVGEVIVTQGTVVPTYWEIGQSMVEGWVKRMESDAAFARERQQLPMEEFGRALDEVIARTIADDREGKYARLREAREKGDFTVDEDRLKRTLSFLTHSGWIYWDERLFEERVIIGQQWALDGIYAVLDRRKKSAIYRELIGSDGRFSASELAEWVWNEKGYSKTEQELLLSLMVRCRLCFQLRKASEAWRDEDVYVSFEHLPTAKELRLQREFDRRTGGLEVERQTLEAPRVHKQHWQAFLTEAGSHYGKDAQYAVDGIYLENKEGEKVLVLFEPDRAGLGGTIEIQVAGAKARERLGSVAQHLQGILPSAERRTAPPLAERSDPTQQLGTRQGKSEVFISYAWNPDGGKTDVGYEEPVKAIERFLADQAVTVILDRTANKFGGDLREFMRNGPKAPHVIVVHSDRYWRSPNCIYELKALLDELRGPGKSFLAVVIPVEHLNSRVDDRTTLDRFLDEWRIYKGENPSRLGWDLQRLRDYAVGTMVAFSDETSALLNVNLRWSDGEGQVLAEIARRLGLAEAKQE